MSSVAPINQGPVSYTPDQMKLITDVVARGATGDELKLFLYRCQNLGLDPLKPGQIYFVKYGTGAGSIVVGIDGFRARANRTGKLGGIKRGAIKEGGKLVGAWAEVKRKDWDDVARIEVSLAEYNTGKAMWAKMPETMIQKVAECAALRMAFPDELGGVYGKEEMDQAEKQKFVDPTTTISEEPEVEIPTSQDPGSYIIRVGKKYLGKKLSEVPTNLLLDYASWLSKQENISEAAEEFIEAVSEYAGEKQC